MSQPRELIKLKSNPLSSHKAGVPKGTEPTTGITQWGQVLGADAQHTSTVAAAPALRKLCRGLGFLCCIARRRSTGDHHSSSSPVVWHKQITAGTKMVSIGLLTLREANHKRAN